MDWPSTTELIKFFGLTLDYEDFGTEAATDRGKLVHAGCHMLASGDSDPAWEARHPECHRYLDAYRKFLREHHWVFIEAEREYRNTALRFLSHPDQLGRLDNFGMVDLELKSGSLPNWVRLQTAGQVLAIGNPLMRRFALHLKSDGNYALIPHEEFRDIDRFRAMVDTYWTIQEFRNGEPTYRYSRG